MINAAALNVIALPSPMAVVERFHGNPELFQGRRAILHMENPLSPFNAVYSGELAVDGEELTLNLDEEQSRFGETSLFLVSPEYNNFYKHGIISLSLQ